MSEVLTTELKEDLLDIYKKTGDLLNLIQDKNMSSADKEIQEFIELIKFRLHDFEGTLQKDIYNCDYLITKIIASGSAKDKKNENEEEVK
ncbi:MAG: hypothetical protein N2645_07150 [Clostridia bacterium]|nr:hypothetical protein [Clostridia bacterium]